VVYITISTGIGGSRIVDQKIDANRFGFEPGHQIIDILEDGSTKSLLEYASGSSIKKIYNKEAKDIDDENIWNDLSEKLAYGINNVIVFWSPDVVVLGGSMMNSPGISLERVKSSLKDTLKIFPEYSEIKKASLGDSCGLFGALAYLKNLEI